MVSITIIDPSELGSYPSGKMGKIQASIESSGFSLIWKAKIYIYDESGVVVWGGNGTLKNGQIEATLDWPEEEGQYTVEIQCFGMMGGLLCKRKNPFFVKKDLENRPVV